MHIVINNPGGTKTTTNNSQIINALQNEHLYTHTHIYVWALYWLLLKNIV